MAEDRAADDRQIGIRADEVVGEERDEVEQAAEGRAVDLHRAVLGAERDAVLVIVDIGGILQKPVLPRELDRDQTVVFTRRIIGAAGIALRLAVELALGIARGSGAARRGDRARVLFRLGEVDGDVKLAVFGGRLPRLPLAVLGNAVAADIVRVTGKAIVPVRRRSGALGVKSAEAPDRLRGPRRQHAHQAGIHQIPARNAPVDHAARRGVVQDGF